MKAHLLFRDADFNPEAELPPNADDLIQDLELDTLLRAMAGEDDFLFAIARTGLLTSQINLDTIHFRQDILRDCLAHSNLVRELYDIAVEALGYKKRNWHSSFDYASGRLSRAVELIAALSQHLRQVRAIADKGSASFTSEGFSELFSVLRDELDDRFFDGLAAHLQAMRFRAGTDISAHLGDGNRGVGYVLRKPPNRSAGWLTHIIGDEPTEWVESVFEDKPQSFVFHLHPRDEAGARYLGDLRNRGLVLVANALDRSVTHMLSFFAMLRNELGFYVACLNLADHMRAHGATLHLPEPAALGERRFVCKGLYDICLALTLDRSIVGNDIEADGKALFVVTGANQGGKSTFLRSVGLAQLMMQAGMFVAAEAYASNVCDGLFTHYKREEDAGMTSGKLDEELARMSAIADWIKPNSLLLSNESLAATNEREGSEIARNIIAAFLEHGIEIVLVTHLYNLAHGFCAKRSEEMIFLRAERRDNGERTFRLIEADPLETSYGEDLYTQVFGETEAVPAQAAQ